MGGYAAGMVRRRSGAALGLQALAPHLAGPLLTQALEFLLTQGLADEALIDDGYLTVGDQMMQAGGRSALTGAICTSLDAMPQPETSACC